MPSDDMNAAKKTIAALGADRLTGLLLNLAERIPAVKLTVDAAVAAVTDPSEAAAQIDAEIAAIRADRREIRWNEFPDFDRDLCILIDTIVHTLADADPALAFGCLCNFIEMGGSVLERSTDDGFTFSEACEAAGPLIRRIPAGAGRDRAMRRAREIQERDDHGIAMHLMEIIETALRSADETDIG
jgi:uncharacterized protein DUF6880